MVPSFLPIEFQDARATATLAHLKDRLIGAEGARPLQRQLTSQAAVVPIFHVSQRPATLFMSCNYTSLRHLPPAVCVSQRPIARKGAGEVGLMRRRGVAHGRQSTISWA